MLSGKQRDDIISMLSEIYPDARNRSDEYIEAYLTKVEDPDMLFDFIGDQVERVKQDLPLEIEFNAFNNASYDYAKDLEKTQLDQIEHPKIAKSTLYSCRVCKKSGKECDRVRAVKGTRSCDEGAPWHLSCLNCGNSWSER